MRIHPFHVPTLAIALAALAASDVLAAVEPSAISPQPRSDTHAMKANPYVGMWVTADGHVRHELLANGRYDEARGRKKSAYQGSYTLSGNHIDYLDDTGFTADGEFLDEVLYHGGMVLYREGEAK